MTGKTTAKNAQEYKQLAFNNKKMDSDATASTTTWMPSSPQRPAVTLTFDL